MPNKLIILFNTEEGGTPKKRKKKSGLEALDCLAENSRPYGVCVVGYV